MNKQNESEFPKLFVCNDLKKAIPADHFFIQWSDQTKLKISAFVNQSYEIMFHGVCTDDQDQWLQDKILVMNLRVRCSNNIDLKLITHELNSYTEMQMISEQKSKTIYSEIDGTKMTLDAEQFLIQLDVEKWIQIDLANDQHWVNISSFCIDADGEKSKSKMAMLNLYPNACNTLFVNVYTRDYHAN